MKQSAAAALSRIVLFNTLCESLTVHNRPFEQLINVLLIQRCNKKVKDRQWVDLSTHKLKLLFDLESSTFQLKKLDKANSRKMSTETYLIWRIWSVYNDERNPF